MLPGLNNQGRTIINNPGNDAVHLVEKKACFMFKLIHKKEAKKLFRLRVKHSKEGEPQFEKIFSFLHYTNVLSDISQIKPEAYEAIRKFKIFYGPTKEEEEDYLRSKKIKEEPRLKYLNQLLDYWFVSRGKLKERSTLHRLLLDKEEKQPLIDKLMGYYKKFKPNKLKEEGFQ